MISISIFGSTGSIGTSTLRLIESYDNYKIHALIANENVDQLIRQCKKHKPKYAIIRNINKYNILREALKNYDVIVESGEECIEKHALSPIDIVAMGVSGFKGLKLSLLVIGNCKKLLLANKESLVSGGFLIKNALKNTETKLIPIDSEHISLFQILERNGYDEVNDITLTASGGMFWNTPEHELERITNDMALNHPTWSMGKKITIDSSTMMNKALEIIEAAILFPSLSKQISVKRHPESIVHGMVSYNDGTTIALMSMPDMIISIGTGLTWPNRLNINKNKSKNLSIPWDKLKSLNFEDVCLNKNRSKALKLAYDIIEEGISSKSSVFNAANEAAVHLFLQGKIKFNEIVKIVEYYVLDHNKKDLKTYQDIEQLHNEIYYSITQEELLDN